MDPQYSAIIAIVDDEESVCRAFTRLFRSLGYEVRSFSSGAEFLATLTQSHYDCLILDLWMPKMSGLDVQLDKAFLEAKLPTVIISACAEPDARRQCMAAGATAYLCKPFDDSELLRAVVNAINNRSSSSLAQ